MKDKPLRVITSYMIQDLRSRGLFDEAKELVIEHQDSLLKRRRLIKKDPTLKSEIKHVVKKFYATPEVKQRKKEYYLENKEKWDEYRKEYYSRPYVKQRRKEYAKTYNEEYYSRPEIKQKRSEYYKARYLKKKMEKQNEE